VGRRIELTREGAIFLGAAKAMLAQAQAAENLLADLGGMRRGTLSIFASQTIANFWLPERLVRYADQYPDIELNVSIGNTAESIAAVMSGDAEIGLVEGEVGQPKLKVELVATDHLAIVVGAHHEWASCTPALPEQITSTKWALREKGSGTRSTFERVLEEYGISGDHLSVAMELPSNEALCRVAAASGMATVVSTSVAHRDVEAGRLHVIPFDLGTRDFLLIRHRGRALSHASKAFGSIVTEGSRRQGSEIDVHDGRDTT
jgi:DNA-binding transcriptional LysR family regulator